MEDKLHQFYNENEEYFNLADEGHENIFPIHREILDKCKDKSGLIVELGCGTGIDSIAMSGKDNYVMGIDISELAIKKARKRAEGIEGVEFKESNLEALPLEDNSVDVIASFFTFEHLFNPERVLSEINRVLKKNGECFILCPSFASPFRGAPVYGGIRKVRILKKMILSLVRMFSVWIFGKKDFRVKMIDKALIDFKKVGKDWDATNEPFIFEFVKYFRRLNYKVSFDSWLTPPKTKEEKFFSNFKKFPIIKYWGPIVYIHAQKR